MKSEIQRIEKNELVLVCFTDYRTSPRRYNPRLFYSDGRVAQTGLTIGDPKSEVAKIEVPEALREEMKQMTLNDLGEFGKQYPEVVETQTTEKVWTYKITKFIERAISEGNLKDYIAVFGRNQNSSRWGSLEQIILYSENPLTIFGCQQDNQNGDNILDFYLEKHGISFGGKIHQMLIPKISTYRDAYIIIPTKDLVQVVVGTKEIRSFLSYPEYKSILDIGIIPNI